MGLSLVYMAPWMVGVFFGFWLLYGWITSRENQKTHESTPIFYRIHLLIVALAITVSVTHLPGWWGVRPFYPFNWSLWTGWILLVSGMVWAVWARLNLGIHWSSAVQLREKQQVVQTGPYRWVRHPIYTGIILIILGLNLINPQWTGFLGWILVVASYWVKSGLEEKLLVTQFGDEYRTYQQRSRRLIPWIL
ncbi:hypothetical protein JIR001_08240 [Polycladomyces abyssicola]|uniref:Protein-S-isoprenylcysteine O-methyltransferase n=1 Tax=Polycladomyces abyssicola TaxID=1125966 RepID=A0A8D5UCU9_9BACL|nr:isoprenylcysteine carboxylmethyltransferase family protein [Polycladomyces abyssicola]BCU81041.1 hypothetical protein JIR001_08240 [Polycladomyces abyssicola]